LFYPPSEEGKEKRLRSPKLSNEADATRMRNLQVDRLNPGFIKKVVNKRPNGHVKAYRIKVYRE
jgi:hypothetical protein